MNTKLKGSQFRWLNEMLYTIPGSEALAYFQANPQQFDAYHSGFRSQVTKWPTNPNVLIAAELARFIQKANNKAATDSSSSSSSKGAATSPSSPAVVMVGDFGCGEAQLAQQLMAKSKGLRCKVHSFDLVKRNKFITVCDIAKVPLPNASLDVAVFCLALMGTNFEDFVVEAHRTLKMGFVVMFAF
jgi:ribosomal RNA-processing protein 8